MRVRWTLNAAFVLMGFSFSITQALLVRELLISFSGNEMSIGLVLGSWLALEAAGAGLVGRIMARGGASAARYASLQCAFALLLIPVLWAAFAVRQWWGGVPGEALGLPSIFVASFLILMPLGLVDGAMFAVACRAAGEYRPVSGSAGRVYVAEAVGGIAGGLAFTYLFIPHLHAIQVALLLATLNLASALSLLSLRPPDLRRGSVVLGALLTLAGVALVSPAANALHRRLVASQWRGYDLAFYGNSVYGNVAAIRQGVQFTFFANGAPILTSPVPDIVLTEELVHVPLLFVQQPRNVLVLGGGVGGVIHELLKYPLHRLDYAELDPLLIDAVASLPTPLTAAELNDARVRVVTVDGRLFVRQQVATQNPPQYDLILLNLPYPTTLQLNRFYTLEFWQMAQRLLADGGVIAFSAPASLSYISPAMRDLHNGFRATLSHTFPHVRAVPGDVTLWVASESEPVEGADVEVLVARWRDRHIPSQLMTAFHIRLRLDERWLEWFEKALAESEPDAVNHDLRPSGLRHGLALWNEMFSPELVPLFGLMNRLTLPPLAIGALLLAVAATAAMGIRPCWRAGVVPIAIAATGFGGMTADLLIIFAFQVYHGYVYHQVALLITAFMAGLSLGGRLAMRAPGNDRADRRWFLGLEAALVIFWLGLLAALDAVHGGAGSSFGSPAGVILVGINALAGLLVGAQFPLANRLYARTRRDAAAAAGLLYAADLTGAFIAAPLVSVVLLPTIGIAPTCGLVAILKGLTGILAVAFVGRGAGAPHK